MVTFGTGGFRAIIGDEFTKENIQIIGSSLAQIILKKNPVKPVVIGYDRRFLSKEAGQWLAEILLANQIPVAFIPYSCPTPLVMYTVKQKNLDFGCMITASHNPAIYNGIKIFVKEGRDADKTFTDHLEKIVQGITKAEVAAKLANCQTSMVPLTWDPFNDYLDEILKWIDTDKIRQAHLKIAFDPMYGVATTALQTILLISRCNVDVINSRHDTLFGGKLPSPDAQTIKELQLLVQEKHYDIGLATDGDADRLGVVDADGSFVDPNKILTLVYYYFLEYRHFKGNVVRNLATTTMVDRIAYDYGFRSIEVPVGFKYVTEAMKKYAAILGGESSGGLTVKGYLNGKDSIFAGALLVEMVAVTGKTITTLVDEIEAKYGKLYTTGVDIQLTPTEKVQMNEKINDQKRWQIATAKEISFLDGVKIWFDHGWCLARLSGTEPLLRLTAESDDETLSKSYIQLVKKQLEI